MLDNKSVSSQILHKILVVICEKLVWRALRRPDLGIQRKILILRPIGILCTQVYRERKENDTMASDRLLAQKRPSIYLCEDTASSSLPRV